MTASAAQSAVRVSPAVGPPPGLRRACNELIGMVMFGQMLRQARRSVLQSKLFHSPGERMFADQLDDLLIRKATSGDDGQGPFGELAEGLCRQLAGRLQAAGAREALDVRG